MGQVIPFKKADREREQRKLDPKRQDLVRRIVAGQPETKWDEEALQSIKRGVLRGR